MNIYSDIRSCKKKHEYIWTFVRVNLLIQIYSDIRLCQNFHECHTLVCTYIRSPGLVLYSGTTLRGWGGEDIEFREFSGLWYLYVRRWLVPGSMASRAYDIIIGLRDPRSNAEACKGPGCCPPA